jgi:hypothetical protein
MAAASCFWVIFANFRARNTRLPKSVRGLLFAGGLGMAASPFFG